MIFSTKSNTANIPEVKIDGKLINRLLVIVIAGFDRIMDKESQLYLRLFARLADKAFTEYVKVREFLIEEIETQDRLAYRIEIINHLENCVSAISGVGKILHRLENGLTTNDSTTIKKNLDIYKLISNDMKKKVSQDKFWNIRNMVEHIDKEVYLGNFQDHLFLDTSEDYKNIRINGVSISFESLAEVVKTYHEMTVQIFNKLPNRIDQKGKYFYD